MWDFFYLNENLQVLDMFSEQESTLFSTTYFRSLSGRAKFGRTIKKCNTFSTKSLNRSEFQYFAMQKNIRKINRINDLCEDHLFSKIIYPRSY